MKPLASEREYLLEIIHPETGRKTPPMTISLGELVKRHNEAIAGCQEEDENHADKDLDPYVNIFFDVTDGLELNDQDHNKTIPIFRMSTLELFISQESVQ